MLFSTHCAGCNEPGSLLCHRCRFALAAAPARTAAPGVHAALPFDGVARQVVLGLKYRNRRGVARSLARLMVSRLRLGGFDLVTWAPTSAAHARERGFDQAELLARAVAREMRVPCRRMLYRAHGSTPQTGRSRAERLHGPEFRARPSASRLRVLVVDDVVTTGATLASAREALLHAGVGEVVCMAAAATPAHPAAAPGQSARPAQRRTVAMAAVGSSSTSTPRIPTASAAATLVGTSSRKAVRAASAPSLARAS